MKRTLMAVVAHPDDESFGMGGTLSRYVREGADVHIVVATDGVAGSVAEGFEEQLAMLVDVRAKELDAAVAVLGGTLHKLGFRDSGYIGDPANLHPDAFMNVDEAVTTAPLIELMREIRPQVVITHDETGGYYHPDHIQCCKITTAAFFEVRATAAQNGSTAITPQRLYYSAFPKRLVRFYASLMRLRGEDPTRMGRNKDIDFTNLGVSDERLHTRIDYRPYWEVKRLASAQHPSQGGGTSNSRSLPDWFQRRFLAREYFMRAYPAVPDRYREYDFFAGLDGQNGDLYGPIES